MMAKEVLSLAIARDVPGHLMAELFGGTCERVHEVADDSGPVPLNRDPHGASSSDAASHPRPCAAVHDRWALILIAPGCRQEICPIHLRQGGETAFGAQVDQLDAAPGERRRQRRVLPVDPLQAAGERMAPGRCEEVVVGEVDPDQADPCRAHVHGEADGDIG